MRALQDNGITWYSCDPIFEENGNIIANFPDMRDIDSWLKEVNEWQSDNLSKYITTDKVGDFLRANSSRDEELFFGYENGELASLAVIEGKSPMYEFVEFNNYIAECKRDGVDEKPNHLNMYQAMRALINTKESNNSIIRFFVVNPKMQNRGIGTRSVRTILNNMEYFSGSKDNNVAQALIHYQNIASQKIFNKNNFYPVHMSSQDNLAKDSDYKVVTSVYDNYYHVF